MFKAHDVSYSIYKRHEAGDVVTAGGEMGLGAVATLEEEEEEWDESAEDQDKKDDEHRAAWVLEGESRQ